VAQNPFQSSPYSSADFVDTPEEVAKPRAAIQTPTKSGASAFDPLFERYGKQYDLPPALLKMLAGKESSFNPTAVGGTNSNGSTDYGLMQHNSRYIKERGITDWSDPEQSVAAAAKLLRQNLAASNGDMREAVRRYNGSGPAAERYADDVMAKFKLANGEISNSEYARMVSSRVRPSRFAETKPASIDDEFSDAPISSVGDEFVDSLDDVKSTSPRLATQQDIENKPYLDRLTEETKGGFGDMTRSLTTARWALGAGDANSLAEELAQNIQDQAKKPKTAAQQEIDAAYKGVSDADGALDTTIAGGKALWASLTNPKETSIEIARSAANSLPSLVSGAAGAGGGALAGSVVPGLGTAAGAIAGGRAGMALGTTATELGAEVQDMVQKRLESNKQQPTAQNVLAILSDKEFQSAALKQGAAKGLTVAAVDQLFMGLGGKIATAPARSIAAKELAESGVDMSTRAARKEALGAAAGKTAIAAAKPSMGAKVGAGAAAVGVDAVGESLGEGLSQQVARGEVDYGDALREGVASMGQSVAQTAVGATIETAKVAGRAAAPQKSGPLSRATESAAAAPERVTVTAPDGEVSGTVTGSQPGAVQITGDDGQVYNFKTGPEGVQITPEAPNTPLTNALEVAAEAAPDTPVLEQNTAPAPVETAQAAIETVAEPVAEPATEQPKPLALSDMDEPALRERMKYLATQAKTNGGWDKMLVSERRKVEKEINSRAPKVEAPKVEQPALDLQPQTTQPKGATNGTETTKAITPEAKQPAQAEPVAEVTQPAQPGVLGEVAGESQPTQAAPVEAKTDSKAGPASLGSSKADMDHLFGVDAKRAKALDRIAAGKAWFNDGVKAKEFIAKNGLKDTHEAVKGKGGRWDIVDKAGSKPDAENARDKNGYAQVKLDGKKHFVTPYDDHFVIRDATGATVRGENRQNLKFDTEANAIGYASENAKRKESTNVSNTDTSGKPASAEEVVQKADAVSTPAATIQPEAAKEVAPKLYEGTHMAGGRAAFAEGKPRALPSYFTKPGDKNSKDWYRGWDAANAAAPVADVSKNTPKVNTSAEPIQKSEKTEQVSENQSAYDAVRNELSKSWDRQHLDKQGNPLPETPTEQPASSPLVQAMNFLMELEAKAQQQGRVVDDRLLTMINQQKAVVKELSATEPTEPTPVSMPANYGAKNKLVSTDRAAEIRAKLKAKLNGSQLNSGIDPEVLALGAELAVFHIEAGVRKFADFAKAIASDLDMPMDKVRPYLRSWYNGARDMMEDANVSIEGMDDANAVREALGSLGTESPAKPMVSHFSEELAKGNMPKDNIALKKMVKAFDGTEPSQARLKQAQEDLEAAIVVESRRQIDKNSGASNREVFDKLIALYNSQPNLNIRTSTSVENMAYSTPAPLAYLTSKLAGIDKNTLMFEPTAGNGMLTITADPKNVTANELDTQRFENLKAQGIDAIQGDALEVVDSGLVMEKSQDAVNTNPPFGSIKDQDGKATKVSVDGYKLGKIDHLIAAEALRTMKDDGKAVLIIGADKVEGGISTDDRIFFNWLYSHYNVTSQFEMDGKLYARQGAGWPVRVISINGRADSSAVSPKPGTVQRVNTWEQVYEQFEQSMVSQNQGIERVPAGSADGAGASNVGTGTADATGQQAGGATQGRSAGRKSTGNVGGKRSGTTGNQPANTKGAMADGTGGERRNEGADSKNRLEAGSQTDGNADEQAGGNQPPRTPRTDRVNQLTQAENAFQAKYVPSSEKKDDGVLIPVNMAQPLQDAMASLEDAVGDIDDFARKELGYKTVEELHGALMGLQVDSVAMAIHNIKKGKGTIIADQTGIGKGRQAASIIRWAAKNGKIPVFITVKPSLFTDMYNDLADIGSNDIAPLIINGDESISGVGTEKLFANKPGKHKDVLRSVANSGQLPDGRNAVFLTYSQINTDNVQRQAILSLANQAVFVLDESHNAGGQSSTGEFVLGLLENAAGVTYLSATYAKRPDNMPVYFKTDIGEAVADSETLADAMAKGGLPLQTVVSNNLVKSGQMFRRERSYDGVNIVTKNDTANSKAHEELSDKVTSALRAIVNADSKFHSVFFKDMASRMAEEGKQAIDNAGNQASQSVNHTEFSSVVHNFVRQLLLGLKADTAAEEAIASIKRGEKPLIALDNTMGSFLSEYTGSLGIRPGQPLGNFDYRNVLSRALERSRAVTVDDGKGNKEKQNIPLGMLDPVTRAAYDQAQDVIDELDVTGIPVSPLDWIRHRIEQAGYSVAEITGRDLAVDYSGAAPKLTNVPSNEQNDKVGTTRAFNSGKTDVVILNVSGSTGISLHSSEKFSDQRPRHMIVAQAAQDINIFMQMLGRIHRTGQVNLPSYTLLNVDLPAEKRPTAILSGKMKSLNANTSSNTESATSVKSLDILNKYGDQVIASYLEDNQELAEALGIDDFADGEGKPVEDLARKVTGRLALMPVATQREFYSDIEEQYSNLIDYLNKTNQNDLEPRTFDFDAIETKKETLVEKEGDSPFQDHAEYVEFSIKAQGKPMSVDEIKAVATENLAGKTGPVFAQSMIDELETAYPKFIESMSTDSMRAGAEITKSKAKAFITSHRIGSLWRVEINGETYNGAVINVKNSHKGVGNPYSLSKTTVTLAVNGSLRQVSVPATQFEKIVVAPLFLQGGMEPYFRTPPEGERETAKVITGNLLAAYGELKGSAGTIINFTRQDGSTEQGILLPKKFEFGRDTAGDYRFKSADNAVKFLIESTATGLDKLGIASRDGAVRVVRDGSTIEIRVPKSKLRGGKYFLDGPLRDVVGDFTSKGTTMVATVGTKNASKALDALMRKTSLYAMPSMAEDAKAMFPVVATDTPAFSRKNVAQYVETNIHDILEELSDSGLVDINC
jgi:C-terminal domain on Strawberry notch homologue/P-loop containing NTP hydrolase pore-1/Transglycosylase SLT domain